jgi:hypothetical protein
MKKALHITALTDKPVLLKNMVEKLAVRHCDIGFGKMAVPQPWKAVETSSIEKYISGTLSLDFSKTCQFKIPFVTSFLFTCTKEEEQGYKLQWAISLS